ncbi:MAG: hypothetical protein QW794_02860, partial [Thermosphaera sp.]
MKLWIILLIAVAAAVAAARPPVVYPYGVDPPSWYALAPEPGYVKLWRTVSSGARVYYAGVDSLENSFILLNASTSTTGSGWTLEFSTNQARTGRYSYRFYYYYAGTSNTATAVLRLTGISAGGNGSVYFYFQPGAIQYTWSVTLSIYINGAKVVTYIDSNAGGNVTRITWFQVHFNVPQGPVTFEVRVTASQTQPYPYNTVSYTIYMDDLQLFPVTTIPAPVETGFNATHNLWRYTNSYSFPL